MFLRVWLFETGMQATGGGKQLLVVWMRTPSKCCPEVRPVAYAMRDLPDTTDANQGQTTSGGLAIPMTALHFVTNPFTGESSSWFCLQACPVRLFP